MISEQSQLDHQMMHRALELGRRGILTTSPNPAVGCVLTQNNRIVGEGWHQKAGQAHAEVNAITAAGAEAKGATAYVTLEPCSHFGRTPPCVNALIDAQVKRVVVAMQDPNPQVAGTGIANLRKAGIEVQVGVLEDAAKALNPGFIHRMTTQLPLLRLKMATSLDARTALANGKSQWITSAAARSDVQFWRAQADAILTGADTVLADNPRLTVRAEQWPATRELPTPLKQPIRVVIDGQNRIHDDLQLFASEAPVWLIRHTEANASRHPHCHQVIVKKTADNKIDLHDAMLELALREVNLVWTECGASLAGALLQQQLVQQLFLYQSTQLLGPTARAALELEEFTELSQAPQFIITDRRTVGSDNRIIAAPKQEQK